MAVPNNPKTILLIGLLFTITLSTFYLGLTGPGRLDRAPARPGVGAPPPALIRPGLSIFFTDPTREIYQNGPETGLVAAIDRARAQVDLAAYDLDLWGLRDALIAAARRGVLVRLVVEADHLESPGIAGVISAGIPVAADLPDGLMHNKFVVIDRREVWTGSMNFTLNGAYRNDNNLVRLVSPAAAAAYQAEFEEMFLDGLFGAYSPTGHGARLEIAGEDGAVIPIEILFSPDDAVLPRLLALLEGAQDSVVFMAFSFTSDELGEALIRLHQRGVHVRGVFDESQLRSGGGGEYDRLRAAGLDVRIDGGADKLHHKVIVIDGRIVITGSYNFSAAAESRNDENVLILSDPETAARFLAEFERVQAAAGP